MPHNLATSKLQTSVCLENWVSRAENSCRSWATCGGPQGARIVWAPFILRGTEYRSPPEDGWMTVQTDKKLLRRESKLNGSGTREIKTPQRPGQSGQEEEKRGTLEFNGSYCSILHKTTRRGWPRDVNLGKLKPSLLYKKFRKSNSVSKWATEKDRIQIIFKLVG